MTHSQIGREAVRSPLRTDCYTIRALNQGVFRQVTRNGEAWRRSRVSSRCSTTIQTVVCGSKRSSGNVMRTSRTVKISVMLLLLLACPACSRPGAAGKGVDMADKVQSAAARFEEWLKREESDVSGFSCDLVKTDSLMTPVIATISYFQSGQRGSPGNPGKGDIVIEYVFGQQNGRWVFTKGTWTAYHYDGRVNVSAFSNQKEVAQLEHFLNE
jgi:hypothetical protein